MSRSRKMSGGQTPTAPPPWLTFINNEYAKVTRGGKRSTYLNSIVQYFTGAGTNFYPKIGEVAAVAATTLNNLELFSIDPRRVAMQQCIQQNLVENAATSRNRMSDMKTAMDNIKTDARFGRSAPFSSWLAEERAVWDNFCIPINNTHSAYLELTKLKSANQKPTGGTDFTKYYNAVLLFTDFFNKRLGLTRTQLTALELPTYDKRRLQLSAIRQSFKDSLCTTSPQTAAALTQAMAPYMVDPDKNPPTSTPLTAAQKAAYSAIPAKQCSPVAEPVLAGGARRRVNRRTRRRRGSRKH
jgi:hypothetical protein